MKKVWLVALLLIMPGALSAQQQRQERRDALEAQVVARFLENVSRELELSAAGRARLEQHLQQTAPRRRALAQQTGQLRMHLMRAVRDPSTPDAEFARMIDQMTRLRDEEEKVWKLDQAALKSMLTPRQHAQFIMMWIRFNDQIRSVGSRRR